MYSNFLYFFTRKNFHTVINQVSYFETIWFVIFEQIFGISKYYLVFKHFFSMNDLNTPIFLTPQSTFRVRAMQRAPSPPPPSCPSPWTPCCVSLPRQSLKKGQSELLLWVAGLGRFLKKWESHCQPKTLCNVCPSIPSQHMDATCPPQQLIVKLQIMLPPLLK